MRNATGDHWYVMDAAEQLCVGCGEAYRNGLLDTLDYELGVFSRRPSSYAIESVECHDYQAGREVAFLFLDGLRQDCRGIR